MKTVRLASWAPYVLACVAILARLRLGPITIDDAYITFRYARNIAEGMGFVYNPGEHVLGTTTPLYTLILAGFYRLGLQDLPSVAFALNALADGLTTILLFRLTQRLALGNLWSGVLASLFAVSPLGIGLAVGGMESSFFTLLVVASALSCLGDRPALAGLTAGIAAVARPEGALLGVLFVVRYLLERRLPPRAAVLGLVLPVLPWLVFAVWWFGGPLPQTLTAKAGIYKVPILENLSSMLDWLGPIAVTGMLASLWLAGKAAGYIRCRPEALILLAFAPLVFGAYLFVSVKGARVFPWYMVPLSPFALFSAVAAFRRLTVKLPPTVTAVVITMLLGMSLFGFNLGRDPNRDFLAPDLLNVTREGGYAAAARFVAPRLDGDGAVALPEIGAFGYVSRAYVLDLLGLVSPEAIPFYPLPGALSADNAVPEGLLRQRRPDYIVSLDRFLQKDLIEADWFRRDYRLAASFESRIWNSTSVLVFERASQR
ncbi:MAG: hypothetical protein ACYC3S_12255 [Chloroflexota bacterium]